MDVTPRDPDDRSRLTGLIRAEKHAMQRDRFRAIALGLDGEMTKDIEAKLGRSKALVQRWVYAYRDRGLDAIKPGKAPGNKCRLAPDDLDRFRQRVIAGPTEADGVCTLRGLDFQRILRDEFGVEYSLKGIYALPHRLGVSSLAPRPRHRSADPAAQEQFKIDTPPLWMSSDGKHNVYMYRFGFRTNSEPASKAR